MRTARCARMLSDRAVRWRHEPVSASRVRHGCGRARLRQAVPVRSARSTPQRHRCRRTPWQRALSARAVAPTDAILHQLLVSRPRGLRHRAHFYIRSAVRTHSYLPLYRSTQILLLPHMPTFDTVRVSTGKCGTNDVGLPHTDSNSGAMGGGLSSLSGEGSLHVVASTVVRARHCNICFRLQCTQILRGTSSSRGRSGNWRSNILRTGRRGLPHR